MNLNLTSDPASELLGTGYSRFNWEDKIYGLCKLDGGIQVLAVASKNPGAGDFRKFIQDLKSEFDTIRVWHVDNEFLPSVLMRYGFRHWNERFCIQGEWEDCDGWRWDL